MKSNLPEDVKEKGVELGFAVPYCLQLYNNAKPLTSTLLFTFCKMGPCTRDNVVMNKIADTKRHGEKMCCGYKILLFEILYMFLSLSTTNQMLHCIHLLSILLSLRI